MLMLSNLGIIKTTSARNYITALISGILQPSLFASLNYY